MNKIQEIGNSQPEIGHIKGIQHAIVTNSVTPIIKKEYSITYDLVDSLKKELNVLIEQIS